MNRSPVFGRGSAWKGDRNGRTGRNCPGSDVLGIGSPGNTAGANVFVNDAKVTKPDVMASNGVIHVINRVLIPPA
jgi:hypothetical protein